MCSCIYLRIELSYKELIEILHYKLYNDPDNNLCSEEQVLLNRGIPLDKQVDWLNAGWESIHPWRSLKNIDLAANEIYSAVQNGRKMLIVQDPDVDGLTSTAIAYNFLWLNFKDYAEKNVRTIIHDGKQHGLADLDLKGISDWYDIIWVPDAGSNDFEQHKYLADNGVSVVISDHHECPEYSDNAIVVNNQMCDYPDKNLSGAGVTWQLCRAIEDIYGIDSENSTDKLLDLCALGNLADMMDYREQEVRAVVNLGLSNINNPFMNEIITKNKYSFDKMNGVNYYSCAFYCAPFLNAVCRTGTKQEKQLVLNAFLLSYCNMEVESSCRGEFEPVPLYHEAVTVVERVKRRQTKMQNEVMELLETQIEDLRLAENAIITCVCSEDEVAPTVCGLAANKIQSKYQHPTLVLRKIQNEDGTYHLTGSARNYSNCEIEDMRGVCEGTGLVNYAQGHSSAFGIDIPEDSLDEFLAATNVAYEGIVFKPVYYVDYSWNQDTADYEKILHIGKFDFYGQNVQESKVYVSDIKLSLNSVTLMSPDKHPTLKVTLPSGISIIKFKSSKEEFDEWVSSGKVLNIIAKCQVNEWMGRISPQLIVEDFELVESKDDEDEAWVF